MVEEFPDRVIRQSRLHTAHSERKRDALDKAGAWLWSAMLFSLALLQATDVYHPGGLAQGVFWLALIVSTGMLAWHTLIAWTYWRSTAQIRAAMAQRQAEAWLADGGLEVVESAMGDSTA